MRHATRKGSMRYRKGIHRKMWREVTTMFVKNPHAKMEPFNRWHKVQSVQNGYILTECDLAYGVENGSTTSEVVDGPVCKTTACGLNGRQVVKSTCACGREFPMVHQDGIPVCTACNGTRCFACCQEDAKNV